MTAATSTAFWEAAGEAEARAIGRRPIGHVPERFATRMGPAALPDPEQGGGFQGIEVGCPHQSASWLPYHGIVIRKTVSTEFKGRSKFARWPLLSLLFYYVTCQTECYVCDRKQGMSFTFVDHKQCCPYLRLRRWPNGDLCTNYITSNTIQFKCMN